MKKKKMGDRYNEGKLRWRNVPLFLMEPLVEVGDSAEKRPGNKRGKYPTFNFMAGLSILDCMDSLKRHLMKFEDYRKPDIDEESNTHHLACVAWNALVALHFLKTRPELDDRYKGEVIKKKRKKKNGKKSS